MESSLKAIQVKLKLFLKNLEFAISLCSAYHPPFAVTGALPKQPSSSLSSFMTLTLSWIYSAPPFITFITLRWSKWSTMLPDASLRYNHPTEMFWRTFAFCFQSVYLERRSWNSGLEKFCLRSLISNCQPWLDINSFKSRPIRHKIYLWT